MGTLTMQGLYLSLCLALQVVHVVVGENAGLADPDLSKIKFLLWTRQNPTDYDTVELNRSPWRAPTLIHATPQSSWLMAGILMDRDLEGTCLRLICRWEIIMYLLLNGVTWKLGPTIHKLQLEPEQWENILLTLSRFLVMWGLLTTSMLLVTAWVLMLEVFLPRKSRQWD